MDDLVSQSFFGSKIRPEFVPASNYNDPELARMEKAKLWPKVWQLACREEEIPEVGDFINYEILDESILIVRTKKDEISAFYNVCQHRGRRLRDEVRGNVAQGFVCRFHGWRYALDGTNVFIYDKEDWGDCRGFAEADFNLQRPRVDRWAGWVWVSMDPAASSLRDFLGPVVELVKNFDLERQRFSTYETLIAPVNWKIVVEAFNEGYHSHATHNRAIEYRPMESPTYLYGQHAMYFTRFRSLPKVRRESGNWTQAETMQDFLYHQVREMHDTLFALVMPPLMRAFERLCKDTSPDESPEQLSEKLWIWHQEEIEKAGDLWWPPSLTLAQSVDCGNSWHIFPNTIIFPVVDGTLWYRIRPHGHDPDKIIFDIWVLRPYKEGREPVIQQTVTDGFEAFRGRNPFLEQDFENMIAVNKGIKSAGWRGAVCNPRQEPQISHFHRILREYIAEDARDSADLDDGVSKA